MGACLLLGGGGCMYKIGSGLVAGALDEVGGEGRSPGVDGIAQDILDKQLMAELGHQLGSGLSAGATDISPEQQQKLEAAIDGLITVATMRAGQGIRNEVSPEMREMIRKDIVLALAEGFRGELKGSLEDMVEGVVSSATTRLKEELRDEDLKYALSDVLRESIYIAMREGQGGTPAVGETIESTMTENLLMPFERSVGGLTDNMVAQVTLQAQSTERTLKGIISFLFIAGAIGGVVLMVNRRQLTRAQERAEMAAAGQRSVSAALDLLDEGTRARILDKAHEYQQIAAPPVATRGPGRPQPPPPPSAPPSDDYMR